jgi:hypothetical protein
VRGRVTCIGKLELRVSRDLVPLFDLGPLFDDRLELD